MCYGPQFRLPTPVDVPQGFAGPVARTEFPRSGCFRGVRSPPRVRLSLTCVWTLSWRTVSKRIGPNPWKPHAGSAIVNLDGNAMQLLCDLNGTLVRKLSLAGNAPPPWDYQWDVENRLTYASRPKMDGRLQLLSLRLLTNSRTPPDHPPAKCMTNSEQ